MPYFKERVEKNIIRAFDRIHARVYTPIANLNMTAYITEEPVPYSKRETGRKLELKKDDPWGRHWDCAWFHVTGTVPESAAGQSTALYIDVGGECLVYDKGIPVQGLTYVEQGHDQNFGYPGKRVYRLSPSAKGGEVIDLWMDVGCNALLGNSNHAMVEGQAVNGVLRHAEIVTINENLRQLFYDFQVLIDLMHTQEPNSARRGAILHRLHDAAKVLKTFSEEEVCKARAIVAEELNKKGGDPSFAINALGHSHIDLAWLWPIRETRRKGGRTFSTLIRLMDWYPEYKFGASQPQLFEWLKADYPTVYEGVKKLAAQGRFELQGAMWCEPDTNVPSGESLVRQLIYGKKFWMDEFGKEIRNLWLPDVFGYSAALPQILKLAGVDYFMTTKLAFNEHNRFPYHSFFWEGIDGTKIMSHMLPEGTYNGAMTPGAVKHAERNHAENGLVPEALMLYGIGDGGGGPGMEHLERASRMKNIDGLAPITQGFAEDFFHRLEKYAHRMETYRGELYFERHQGTYTTQCKTKWYNRKIEFLFKELEMLLAASGTGAKHKDEIDTLWKEFLLYQFHDILPGSSINRVYDEALVGYEQMYNRVQELICETAKNFQGDTLVVNTLSWGRWEWVEIDGKYERVYAKGNTIAPPEKLQENVTVSLIENGMENEFLRVVFNEDGSLGSVFDKLTQVESLAPGSRGNLLSVWDDQGDCWDIPVEYRYLEPDYFALKSQTLALEDHRAVMCQEYAYGKSTITQEVCLYAGKGYLDFRTTADWQEDRKMLRAGFDVSIQSQYATYEIQFGYLRRSVSDNNPYEMAQFEACGHKWADLSQTGRGVALINDCKYGYRIKGNTMELDLLRAQNYPGIGSDRGFNEFAYALYPHNGDLEAVTKEAHGYNLPLRIALGGGDTKAGQIFDVSGPVVLDTVKPAEDESGIVTRLYEPLGANGIVSIAPSKAYKQAVLCDLIENTIEPLPMEDGKITLAFKPFQIMTVKWSDK